MKLFIDSADPKDIADCAATGLIDGVTTNPSLAAKTGLNFLESLERICAHRLTDKGLAAFLEDAKRAGTKLTSQ